MNPLVLSLTLLGRLLSERPSVANQTLFLQIHALKDWVDWPNPSQIDTWLNSLPECHLETLEYEFSVLFEGQGEMECPPWGSVYLTQHNVVFGASTFKYRQFMQRNGYEFDESSREPEDQFGLMLLSFCQLLTDDKEDAAYQLLTDHLLPWGQHYLELLAHNKRSDFYQVVAKLTQTLLSALRQEFEITPKEVNLYY